MRLPFPERLPLKSVFFFAAGLCAVQLMEGTNATFSLGCFFYILTAALAFNVAGGITRPSGGYILFNAVLTFILGVFWKAVLGEPADSNLLTPVLTVYIYFGGMAMMLVAAYLSRKVTPKRALLGNILPDYKIQTATVGCTIVGFLIVAAGLLSPGGEGSLFSALNQINHFFAFAIILGVIHTVKRTGGRSSLSVPVLLSGGFLLFSGIIGFSKEGMLSPFAAWALAAASQRYRITLGQILVMVLGVFFVFHYLVPYAQYGRNFEADTIGERVENSINLLSNLGEVREKYLESASDSFEENINVYYDSPQGFFDRLQMIKIDDLLIDRTEKFGTFGLLPIVQSFENIVPHFLWKDKPVYLWGNVFAHEVGSIVGAEDESTGISFSSTATAYHMAGWGGIFFLAPALWFLLFLVNDWMCGDVRRAPWGLLMLVAFSHAGPEGDLTAIIYMSTTGAFGIALVSYLTAYLMPIIGTLFIGPEGVFLKKAPPIRSIPAARRLHPIPSTEN